MVNELAREVAAGTGSTVRAGYPGFGGPTVTVALRELEAERFSGVRVVPLLFTPGTT